MTGASSRPKQWVVLYSDGSEIGDDIPLADLPRFGAVAIVQEDERNGSDLLTGDYFVYRADVGQWFFADEAGLRDHIYNFCPHVEAVLQGRYVTNLEWEELRRKTHKIHTLTRTAGFARWRYGR